MAPLRPPNASSSSEPSPSWPASTSTTTKRPPFTPTNTPTSSRSRHPLPTAIHHPLPTTAAIILLPDNTIRALHRALARTRWHSIQDGKPHPTLGTPPVAQRHTLPPPPRKPPIWAKVTTVVSTACYDEQPPNKINWGRPEHRPGAHVAAVRFMRYGAPGKSPLGPLRIAPRARPSPLWTLRNACAAEILERNALSQQAVASSLHAQRRASALREARDGGEGPALTDGEETRGRKARVKEAQRWRAGVPARMGRMLEGVGRTIRGRAAAGFDGRLGMSGPRDDNGEGSSSGAERASAAEARLDRDVDELAERRPDDECDSEIGYDSDDEGRAFVHGDDSRL